jgi:hypothetical protein
MKTAEQWISEMSRVPATPKAIAQCKEIQADVVRHCRGLVTEHATNCSQLMRVLMALEMNLEVEPRGEGK